MNHRSLTRVAVAAVLALGVAACSDTSTAPEPVADHALAVAPITAAAAKVNLKLAEDGADYVLYSAEYLTSGEGDGVGRTVFFSDVGNKQEGAHFVPGDPRRGGAEGITYINDLSEGSTSSGLLEAQTDAAIGRAMDTWDRVRCSDIPLESLGSYDYDFGVVQDVFGFGGDGQFFYADITHAGFLPGAFFDYVEPGGSGFILGVTYTFMWIDGAGDFTDIDNNGKLDTAFREIYYNDNFAWGIDEALYDVETVVLHETGHGLSQGHFGKVSGTFANGRIHFSPRALMNAGYSGIQQRVVKTDKAGHCSIWSAWPNN